MAKFGNSGVSSLISAANAAVARTNTYNDQEAAFEFDLSAKAPEDYAKYKAYLDKRVAATQSVDPAKALSLTRTGVTANRSFNSAEINRATTSVKFGNSSSRDKYATLANLQQQAAANGDDNLAQSLWGQMASLSVQIQNEDTAAASRGAAAGEKAQTATKAGIDHTLNTYDQAAKLANAQVKAGKMTVQDYEAGMAKYYAAKDQLLQEAAAGQHGDISQDAVNAYDAKHTELSSRDEFTKAMAQYPQSEGGISREYLHVDPSRMNPDGTMAGTLKDRPGLAPREVKNADGSIGYVDNYKGGFQDYSKDAKGNNVTSSKSDRTAFINNGSDYVFSQIGRDKNGKQTTPANEVGGQVVLDQKGNPYVIDQNGTKHYVTTDPNNTLQRSTSPILSDAELAKQFGPATTSGQILSGITKPLTDFGHSIQAAGGLGNRGGIAGLGANLIDRLVGRNNAAAKARQDAINLAAAQKQAQARQASESLAAAQNAKLLPVFRAPAPAPTGPITQYKLPPLPSPVPLGKTGISTPASTGNYQKDVLNLGRSLGNLL